MKILDKSGSEVYPPEIPAKATLGAKTGYAVVATIFDLKVRYASIFPAEENFLGHCCSMIPSCATAAFR